MKLRAPALAAALFVALAAAVFGAGEFLSRPQFHAPGSPPADLFATTVMIPHGKGYVAGWVARGAGSGAVLLLHGVRADRRAMQERALFLNRLGYTVLLIDLPAHGESAGERITFGAREAGGVRAALHYLQRNLPGEKIGVIGVSLGAAALVLSEPGAQLSAVVLESMYPTIGEAVENRLAMRLGPPGAWLAPLLLHQLPLRTGVQVAQLRPVDAITRLQAPLLIVGGEHDLHTTPAQTRKLFDAAPGPKQLWIVPEAAHVDFHAVARADYEARIGQFLARHLRGS